MKFNLKCDCSLFTYVFKGGNISFCMEKTIHVHDVLTLLSKQKEGVTKEELMSLIQENIGVKLSFSTCGVGEYGFEDILIFMNEKNKIIIDENGMIFFNKDGVCNHN